MKYLLDSHTHSIASDHAYSTIDENVRAAAAMGLEMLALTDHAPAMKGTTSRGFFANLQVVPDFLHGVRLLKGVELNIIDFNGTVDLDVNILDSLDIAIASLHSPCIAPGSFFENTNACILAMENPYIDILGHPGDPRYPMDYEAIFRVAQETGTLLEINNASFIPNGVRAGSVENIEKILRMAMKADTPIVMGSDAHFYTGVGDFLNIEKRMEEIGFPQDLVLNASPQKFFAALKRRKLKEQGKKPLL